jgi:ATP-dependent Clp protease ATP-binding subunit ClpB
LDLSKFDFAVHKAMHRANALAKSLGHSIVEPEHLALAVVQSGLVLKEIAVLRRVIREQLERHLKTLARSLAMGNPTAGPRLMEVIDQAETQINSQGAKKVQIDLLWTVLLQSSAELEHLQKSIETQQERQQNFEPLASKGPKKSRHNQEHQPGTAPKNKSRTKAGPISKKSSEDGPEEKALDQLEPYVTDITAAAQRNELDPVLGRDEEVRKIIQVLGRRKKNSPILLGEPGVGKTAIVESLATRIANGRVPKPMRDKRLMLLDLNSIVAGTKFRGEFEQRAKEIIESAKILRDRVIFFVDEIHMLVGTGNQEGGGDLSNLLKPALARGELSIIGATTLTEFRKHFEKDAALERRFQPVMVHEPSESSTIAMLRGIKAKYERHHSVKISDEALVSAVHLTGRFVSNRHFPDKAIDAIDEAATRLRLDVESMPSDLDRLRSRIEQLEIEHSAFPKEALNSKSATRLKVELNHARKEFDALESIWLNFRDHLDELTASESDKSEADEMIHQATNNQEFDLAAKIRYNELPSIDHNIKECRAKIDALRMQHSFLTHEVGINEIAEVISAWTGIPLGRLVHDNTNRILDLEDRIKSRVIGQDHIIKPLVNVLRRFKVGLHMFNRPAGVMFFGGPTGVGKTELARVVSCEVFGNEAALLKVDMSEYGEPHQVARILGAPPGYIGHDESSPLVEGLRANSHRVILLDEIEKAHPKVFDIFLQAFDEGRLTDSRGRLLDLRNTIFIMTSNLDISHSAHSSEEDLRRNLGTHLRPELVNRIDEILIFKSLEFHDLVKIIGRLTENFNDQLADHDIRVILAPSIQNLILDHAHTEVSGGRGLRRAFERIVITAYAEHSLTRRGNIKGAWLLEHKNNQLVWSLEFAPQKYLPASKVS